MGSPSVVSEATAEEELGVRQNLRRSLLIQRLEGSRLVRGGRYGISIDFSLEVVEKQPRFRQFVFRRMRSDWL